MSIEEYYHDLNVVHRTDGNCLVCDSDEVKINRKGATVMIAKSKKVIWPLVAILAMLAVYTITFHLDDVVAGMPVKQDAIVLPSTDKSDDECTGHETAGRCADKCPNQTDTLLGFDQTTGAAICQPASAPVQQIQPIVNNFETFQGK